MPRPAWKAFKEGRTILGQAAFRAKTALNVDPASKPIAVLEMTLGDARVPFSRDKVLEGGKATVPCSIRHVPRPARQCAKTFRSLFPKIRALIKDALGGSPLS